MAHILVGVLCLYKGGEVECTITACWSPPCFVAPIFFDGFPKLMLTNAQQADIHVVVYTCSVQVVELISGGAQIAVTNENKMHYLNLLAQYRLATQVRDEVEHFLKGKETAYDGSFHLRGQICTRLV